MGLRDSEATTRVDGEEIEVFEAIEVLGVRPGREMLSPPRATRVAGAAGRRGTHHQDQQGAAVEVVFFAQVFAGALAREFGEPIAECPAWRWLSRYALAFSAGGAFFLIKQSRKDVNRLGRKVLEGDERSTEKFQHQTTIFR